MHFFARFRSFQKQPPPQMATPEKDPTQKESPPPYHHIPTHAASDALSQGPPGAMSIEDRKAIREHRQRRNELDRQYCSFSLDESSHKSSESSSLKRDKGTPLIRVHAVESTAEELHLESTRQATGIGSTSQSMKHARILRKEGFAETGTVDYHSKEGTDSRKSSQDDVEYLPPLHYSPITKP